MRHGRLFVCVLVCALMAAASRSAAQTIQTPAPPQQQTIGTAPQGSANLKLLSHVPLGGFFHVTNVEMEQELSRPYAYVSRGADKAGFAIVEFSDVRNPHVIHTWMMDDIQLHRGYGGVDGKYFKVDGRHYYAQALQFEQGGPDWDLAAIIFDVTGLPDPGKIREVTRVRVPETPGGYHNLFAYKHSDGRVLLFGTALTGKFADVYDARKLLLGDPARALVGRVPVPDATGRYHDFYIAYDPVSGKDKFYGGAQPGGYFVFDITRPEDPKLLTSVTMGYPAPTTSAFGRGHTITATPDGRYIVTETEYQYAPLRIFDLKPGLDGTVPTITRPIGAWTARWKGLPHNHEVRWPYVFASAYEDGLQIFNIYDPTNPATVGFYHTYSGALNAGVARAGQVDTKYIANSGGVLNGAWGIEVRNADGLILISDMMTGLWALHLEGFDHWNGHDWGMPDISSVQDFDHGPDGVKR